MAEDRLEARETDWRQLLPWTALFQGFRVALDLNKLLLAAGGIVVMALGWWLLAVIFYGLSEKPDWGSPKYKDVSGEDEAARTSNSWIAFKRDREKWNLLHAAAGPSQSSEVVEPVDVAESPAEIDTIRKLADDIAKQVKSGAKTLAQVEQEAQVSGNSLVLNALKVHKQERKASGLLRTLPWFEDRGPNPYLLVTGQSGRVSADGTVHYVPWERGDFPGWFMAREMPVLLEPLFKFLAPIRLFLNPHAGLLAKIYFLLVILVTLATWALFGGAITRIAAVQVARKEKIGIAEALRFTVRRYVSYFSAPLFPIILVAALLVFMMIFGLFHMIPIVGELLDGVLWWLMLILGLVMAVVFVGLVGWPLMSATISAEGTDAWEAVSRSYSYVYQAPWHYIWYTIVGLVYGALVIFFVGFMGSFMVYLAKWGVGSTPGASAANRDPTFLFVYAPTSFGWRDLLLQGTVLDDGRRIVRDGVIEPSAYDDYVKNFRGWNYIGAFLVAVWLYLIFLMVLGFGYSYFWSASTIIYLLMRRKVDDAEMDEVYLEDEDLPESFTPSAGPMATSPAATDPGRVMVESPTLRVPPAATTTTVPEPSAAGAPTPSEAGTPTLPGGDGNSPT
jgi:hypothetical protein